MATRIGCGRICARCREAGGWGSLSPESHPVVQKKDDKGGAPTLSEARTKTPAQASLERGTRL